MALWDANLMVSEEQDISHDTGAAPLASTDVLDTELADPNKGEGTPIYFEIFVDGGDITGTSTSAGTMTVKIQDSDNNSTWYDLVVGEGISYDDSNKIENGTMLLQGVLPNEHQRYLRAAYETATKDCASGKVTAGFKLD